MVVKKAVDYIKVPKKFFYVIVGVLALTILFSVAKPKYELVDAGSVSVGEFRDVIIDEGVTNFKKKYIISAFGDGLVPKIELEEGDEVKKGQKLFTFIWDVNRIERSPIDGVVLKVFEKDKRHILKGSPILEIGDPKSVEVVARLLTEDAVSVKPGQSVTILKWGGEKPLEGVVIQVLPTAFEEVSSLGVKEQRVNVEIKLTSPPELWKQLGDGYKLEVEIFKQGEDQATLLPIGALFETQDGFSAYVIEDSKAKLVRLEVSGKNNDFANIKSGLTSGQQVVLYPSKNIKDGTKVKVK